MHFGIIAAGEGSRLASEGAALPKPLIRLCGEPMISRLVGIFERCGAESVSVVINSRMPEVKTFIEDLREKLSVPLDFKIADTPSSMHTFAVLSEMMRGKGRFVATTVDTVFREEDFCRYVEAFRSAPPSVDGMMAVTDYIDDEKPLYVAVNTDGEITAFLDKAPEDINFVSAGIYGLDGRALDVLQDCMNSGVSRMRNFQRALISSGLNLKCFLMGKVLDIDHVSDVAKAEKFLMK